MQERRRFRPKRASTERRLYIVDLVLIHLHFADDIEFPPPSQIGISKPGSLPTILSPVEAAHITRLCWTEGSTLSKTETIASGVFVVGGSLFVSVVSASTLILTLLARRLPDVVRRLKHSITFRAKVRNMNLRGRHVPYCYLISFCGKLRSCGES